MCQRCGGIFVVACPCSCTSIVVDLVGVLSYMCYLGCFQTGNYIFLPIVGGYVSIGRDWLLWSILALQLVLVLGRWPLVLRTFFGSNPIPLPIFHTTIGTIRYRFVLVWGTYNPPVFQCSCLYHLGQAPPLLRSWFLGISLFWDSGRFCACGVFVIIGFVDGLWCVNSLCTLGNVFPFRFQGCIVCSFRWGSCLVQTWFYWPVASWWWISWRIVSGWR